MQILLNGAQMKAVDRYNIEEIGIPSLVLMERAALAVASEAEKLCPYEATILLICGRGNNGADGLAAARILALHRRKVQVWILGNRERAARENLLQEEILRKLKVPVNTVDSVPEYDITGPDAAGRIPEKGYALIIDAMFGVGLSRPLEGTEAKAASCINQAKKAGSKVLSVDIPSGISADTGQVLGTAVEADRTVTFGYEKLGMVLYPGTAYAGRRVVADIGFAALPGMMGAARSFLPGETGGIPVRRADGNKGTFGRVFLAAGSVGMSGAAFFSGKAAARCGAGLVQIYTVEENRPVLQTLLPEAVVTVFSPEECSLEGRFVQAVSLSRAAVLVAGPGLSVKPYAGRLLEVLLKERKERRIPCVLDADALNLLAEHRDLLDYLDEKTIVTPHMGEMSRLTGLPVGELKKNPIQAAKEFHEKYGAVCVLKDARTVIASARGIYVNLSGNDGMATGGSGDVLSGILGGLLAGGMDVNEAAETGVYLHGLAGDKAAEHLGRHALLAGDILEAAGEILHQWEEKG